MTPWTVVQRVVSLLIGLVYATLLIVPIIRMADGPHMGMVTVACLEYGAFIAIPVALIWFPEQIGAATGMLGYNNITAETPAFLVAMMGWVFLLGAPVVYYLWH